MLVSSDFEELIGLCDRLIVMHDGVLTGELQREEFNQDKLLSYAVGQGEGAAANFLIGQKYPGFYAAQLAISPIYGLQDATADALEREKLWIMTSSNDRQSCDAMEGAISYWKNDDIRVNSAVWDVDWSEQKFAQAAKELAAKKGTVKYTVIDGGCREYAWCIGHRIEAIRDWLMAQ